MADYRKGFGPSKQRRVAGMKSIEELLNQGGRSEKEMEDRYTEEYLLKQLRSNPVDRSQPSVTDRVHAILGPLPVDVLAEQDEERRRKLANKQKAELRRVFGPFLDSLRQKEDTYSQSILRRLESVLEDEA